LLQSSSPGRQHPAFEQADERNALLLTFLRARFENQVEQASRFRILRVLDKRFSANAGVRLFAFNPDELAARHLGDSARGAVPKTGPGTTSPDGRLATRRGAAAAFGILTLGVGLVRRCHPERSWTGADSAEPQSLRI